MRNCAAGHALYKGVLETHLQIQISNPQTALEVRGSVRFALWSPLISSTLTLTPITTPDPVPEEVGVVNETLSEEDLRRGTWMDTELARWHTKFVDRLNACCAPLWDDDDGAVSSSVGGATIIIPMQRGKGFMTDTLGYGISSSNGFDIPLVGSDFRRDPALSIIRGADGGGSGGGAGGGTSSSSSSGYWPSSEGWRGVCFPIIFHIQWDAPSDNGGTTTGKPKLLFHATFHPWAMAVALGMALCSPNPPIQV